MITLHGITNCDTVKKARAWLAERGIEYGFHDYKRAGVPDALSRWIDTLGPERLLNRQGTTWRKLAPEAQAAAMASVEGAEALMRAQPSVIRRPLMVWADGSVTVGFDAENWARRVGG